MTTSVRDLLALCDQLESTIHPQTADRHGLIDAATALLLAADLAGKVLGQAEDGEVVGHCDLEAARAALREAKDALEQIQTVGEDAASDTVRANVLLAHAAMRRVCSVLAPIV